jgi:phosphate transport system substrate-binding protein
MRGVRGGVSAGGLVVAVALSGCGSSGPGSAGGGGSIIIDGSSTVFRISREAQLDYRNVDSSTRVTVANHGTGGGFDRYFQGEVDIIDASRDAKPEETSKAEAGGMPWNRFIVAYDGITVVVNPKNDFVKELSVEQLKSLFAPDSTATTWKDIDPSWPDRKIVLYAPGTASGTFEFFTEAIVGKGIKTNRRDVQASEDDNTLVTGVSGDVDAIGYFGYAYYAANKDKLRAVPIREGEGPAVEPTEATVLDGSYTPLSRPLYIFVKNQVLKRPDGAKFVKHYLDNAARFASAAGYVPPTADDTAANAAAFTSATGGQAEAAPASPGSDAA